MRFLCMHKANRLSESDTPPCDDVMQGLGPLMEEMHRAGVFLSAEGLRPTMYGVRLRFANGQRTLIPGPFPGERELVAELCIVRVAWQEEAIDWASRWAHILGDVEIDVRPIAEAWDMGFCPPPSPDPPIRYMLIRKADASTEAGQPYTAAQQAALQQWQRDMRSAGVLLLLEGLQPSVHGARLFRQGKQQTVVDGPFTETKEMIAGYCLVEVPAREQAIDWSWRFAELVGDIEMDVRPLVEPSYSAV